MYLHHPFNKIIKVKEKTKISFYSNIKQVSCHMNLFNRESPLSSSEMLNNTLNGSRC